MKVWAFFFFFQVDLFCKEFLLLKVGDYLRTKKCQVFFREEVMALCELLVLNSMTYLLFKREIEREGEITIEALCCAARRMRVGAE